MNIERIELKTGASREILTAFYGGQLGLPVSFPDAGTLRVTAGVSELIFRDEPGFVGVYHFAFNVPENRLGAAREYLAYKGVALLPDTNGETVFIFDFWDAHSLYFRDPAGNIAEFIARHELPALSRETSTPFAPAELQRISEIGLPTDDVLTLAARLRDAMRVTTYRKPNTSLVPVGDANGLFIVVPEGRVWFPDTGIPAQMSPVAATVKNARGERFMVSGGNANGSGYTVSGATD